MLLLRDVTVRYPSAARPILQQVSFALQAGEFVFLTGDSGSGKTTLLRVLHGALRPERGSVQFEGQPLSNIPTHHLRRRIGFVFQENRLLPQKTVWENVCFAGEILGGSPREIRIRARELLNLVGLADKVHQPPRRLSVGEQQRVAIARALMNHPRLLLADEPTGHLDPDHARVVLDLFFEVRSSLGTACLIATHALHLISSYPSRRLHLVDGRLTESAQADADGPLSTMGRGNP